MNAVMAKSSFHAYIDDRASYRSALPDWWEPRIVRKHTVIQDRKLNYRFYEHFHPYVRELIQRLIEQSVRGFQAIDTEYQENADGSFKSLPDSLVAVLMNDTQATLPDGTQSKIPRGVHVTLLDGAVINTL